MSYNRVKHRSVKFIDFTEEIKRSLNTKGSPKKSRVKLLDWQIKRLEKAYHDDTHPSHKAKTLLSEATGLPLKSIQIWFQNKRAKEKSRKESQETESESENSTISFDEDSKASISSSINTSFYAKPSTSASKKNDSFESLSSEITLSRASTPSSGSLSKTPMLSDRSARASNKPVHGLSSGISPISLLPIDNDLGFDPTETSELSMTYDECYNAISTITNVTEPFSLQNNKYNSFLSSFSASPLTRTPESNHVLPVQTLSPAKSLFSSDARHNIPDHNQENALQQAISSTQEKYRNQLRTGSIIYNKEQEKADFFFDLFYTPSHL
ncbi:hypothetical protein NEOKW01_1640 [Nematocida sp. AWRm80]|nr:hypothetical protein NEOKW01_1640 [Nematocida sp. AWRm80]